MGIEIIGKLTQKNNGDFKLVDLADVDYDGTGKSAKQELEKKIEEAKNSSTPYDDSAIKADINTIKTDLGTETLNTTAKDVKGAVNEVAAQYKDITNTKADKNDLQVQKSRIDNLTTLPEGSTTGDAELIDGRIGADGFIYENLGNAIRNQTFDITIAQVGKSVIGNAYKVKTSKGYPGITFKLTRQLKYKDIKNIKIVFKIQNFGDLTTAKFQCSLWRNGLNKNVGFNNSFGDTKDGEKHEFVLSADTEYTDDLIIERLVIRLNINTSKNYDFDLYDVDIYINNSRFCYFELCDIEQDVIELNKENTFYLASKKSVDDLRDIVLTQNMIGEIINAYGSATKSNLNNIVCWGDSITAGGGKGQPYPTHLQNLLGDSVKVTNNGIGGNCSGTIAFRQGSNKFTTVDEITIPSNSNETIDIQMNITSGNGKNCRNAYPIDVSIGGINGVLTWKDVYTTDTVTCSFQRKENGESKIIPKNTQVISSYKSQTDDINIIWVGRNDMAFSNPFIFNEVIENIQTMVNFLTPQMKRFLILSTTTKANSAEYKGTSAYNQIVDLNNALKRLYPYNFVDIRDYLVNKCIYDIGLTPTATDLECMANDTLPLQIMASSTDVVHPGPAAKEQIGKFLYNELVKREWVKH